MTEHTLRDAYLTRRVVDRMTDKALKADGVVELNAVTITQEAARRVLFYLTPGIKFALVEEAKHIIEFASTAYDCVELTLDIDTFADRYLDELCFRLAEEITPYKGVAKLKSPPEAHMASRVVDRDSGLVISTVTIRDGQVSDFRTLLMAGVA